MGPSFLDDDAPDDRDATSLEDPTSADDEKGMSENELKAILAGEMQSALGADGGVLSHQRRRLLELYQGGLIGNEVDGRSQVIARNVFEAVEWVTPAILKPFVSTDKICEFEAYRPQEEAQALAATQYINYVLTEDNNFFGILFTLIKDAAIQKNGYFQCYWNEQRHLYHESFEGLSEQQYQLVLQGDPGVFGEKYPGLEKVEVIDKTEYPNGDPMTAQMFPTLYDCKVRVHEVVGKVAIENIAPEEMLISRRAPESALDGKHFSARRTLVRISDLRERGYPEELITQAMGYDDMEYNSERISRFTKDDDWPLLDNRTDPAMRQTWIEESYLSVDYDGDGIAELRRIVSAGQASVIFENDEADDVPFGSLTLIPMSHKHIGMSIAETVSDLQEIESTLWRQCLDNLYISNMPRVIIDEMAATDETFDDLLNPAIGSPIRVANVEGLKPFEVPFTAQVTIPIIDQLRQQQEVRTGIMQQNMTLAPDQLNKYASGEAINLAQQAGSQRIELFARIVAEVVKGMAKKVLGLVVRHQQQARQIKIAGQWLNFDPRTWRESLDCSVSVGLGTGSHSEVMSKLQMLLQVQEGIVMKAQGTPFAALVTPQDSFDLLSKLCEAAGFKRPYFSNPTQQQGHPQPPPPPNPEMVKAQMAQQQMQQKMQLEQAKAQSDEQRDQQRHQMEMQRDQQRHQAEMVRDQQRFQAEVERDRMREQSKGQLMVQKAHLDAQLDIAKAAAPEPVAQPTVGPLG